MIEAEVLSRCMAIPELIENLSSRIKEGELLDLDSFRAKMEHITYESIKDLVEFDIECYNRQILFRVEQFEIILICWLPQQQTPFHGHPANGCMMKLLKGQILDSRSPEQTDEGIVINENEITYLDGSKMHRISNLENKSVSLHIYSPSIFYDIKDCNN